MPRPAKRVAPDTLGGRIREARLRLHLSLADVAQGRYSTSLISQIERNKIDPSPDSLRFLAERLNLPLSELELIMQQKQTTEYQATQYKEYADKREQAQRHLDNCQPQAALELLQGLKTQHMPDSLRWRLIALRGQCHFALRHFQAAQNDLQAAAGQQLDPLPADQLPEATLLHLHLAAASRELGQLDVAYKHYKIVLGMFKLNTPIQYVAEAHWGLALVAYERASHLAHESEEEQQQERALKQEARAHAIKARDLYSSINDELHAALLSCQLGLIEQALGNLETARACLQEVLESWWPRIHGISLDGQSAEEQRTLKERANLVSAAACYLAGLELACRRHEQALAYIHQAQQAAQKSYILRRAEAYIVLGQILEDQDVNNPEAENAFRNAIKELDQTDRVAAKIHAHDLLGRHLLKKRRIEEGTRELDLARGLAKTPPLLSSSTTPANDHL